MDKERHTFKWPSISEIGVVAAVIAVLSVAMVPAVVKARQQARSEQMTCMSNVKQLELGTLQYTQDYDETYPACYKGAPQTWAGRIWPYTKSAMIYRCPTDQTGTDFDVQPNADVVSYGFNSNFHDKALTKGKPTECGMKEKNLESPASTVSFFEVSGATAQLTLADEGTKDYKQAPQLGCVSPSGDGIGVGPEWGWLGKGSSPLRYEMLRHVGRSNVGAADGHVVCLAPIEVSSGVDNPLSTGAQDDPKGAAAGTSAGYRMTFSTK